MQKKSCKFLLMAVFIFIFIGGKGQASPALQIQNEINNLQELNYSNITIEKEIIVNGKTFSELKFEKCNFSELKFEKCNFSELKFEKCNFSELKFEKCNFLELKFVKCNFFMPVNFMGCNIESSTIFRDCNFKDVVSFFDCNFSSNSNCSEFRKCNFKKIIFTDSTFYTSTSFFESICDNVVRFDNCSFNDFDISRSRFNNTVNFLKSQFNGDADFSETIFQGVTLFENTTYLGNKTEFSKSIFASDVSFDNAYFNTNVFFFSTSFLGRATFFNTSFNQLLCLDNASYSELYIDWDKINYFVYDPSFPATYPKFIDNFRNTGSQRDADNSYYQFHKEQILQGSEEYITSIINVVDWIFYGFGKKPLYPLFWSIFFIVVFALIWRILSTKNLTYANLRGLMRQLSPEFFLILPIAVIFSSIWIVIGSIKLNINDAELSRVVGILILILITPFLIVLFYFLYINIKEIKTCLLQLITEIFLIARIAIVPFFLGAFYFSFLLAIEICLSVVYIFISIYILLNLKERSYKTFSLMEGLTYSVKLFLSGTKLFVSPPEMPKFYGVSKSVLRVIFHLERLVGALFSILLFVILAKMIFKT